MAFMWSFSENPWTGPGFTHIFKNYLKDLNQRKIIIEHQNVHARRIKKYNQSVLYLFYI